MAIAVPSLDGISRCSANSFRYWRLLAVALAHRRGLVQKNWAGVAISPSNHSMPEQSAAAPLTTPMRPVTPRSVRPASLRQVF